MTKLTKKDIEPLVSIITPLYNAARFIAQTIASVQAQTYQNWEQIIVDDCSTDDSVQIVKALAALDDRIKLITLSRNSGAAHSRNVATEAAQGKFIAFLDSDDLWHAEKLEKQIAFMQETGCDVSYTSYVHIDEGGKPLGKRIVALPELAYKKQHSNNYVGNLTGIYKTAAIGKISAPAVRKRQDWALWLEAIRKSKKPALGLQEDLAFYRVSEGSMSSNKLNLIKYNYQFYKTCLGYSHTLSALYLLRFFWEYFVMRPKWIQRYEV
ncbi:glycosyl transferase [Dokdonia sp. Dokd-P16]|uniref:glycosyltransferase family 2 protein n=1 Tax=Dokdonia sp. Dokd-P16 TaxID=2173169 RepID=UPI000D54576C|nr:glycosyltransferase family 2 protein [Dokdonia sp. Dokd-P16]AWH73720.1 glycosyl transferase [Dokdonia sp. Dokd-P16]